MNFLFEASLHLLHIVAGDLGLIGNDRMVIIAIIVGSGPMNSREVKCMKVPTKLSPVS